MATNKIHIFTSSTIVINQDLEKTNEKTKRPCMTSPQNTYTTPIENHHTL